MTGRVDADRRALIEIQLGHPTTLAEQALQAWIDTGFTDRLVVPRSVIASFGLPTAQKAFAILANGSNVEMETFFARLD